MRPFESNVRARRGMNRVRGGTLVGWLAVVALAAPAAMGQCVGGGEWVAFPAPALFGPGVGSVVLAVTVWDPDGEGPQPPQLIAGGYGSSVNPDGLAINFIARWDGEASSPWRPLGTGSNNGVNSLTVAGNGMLVAGGSFSHAGGVEVNGVGMFDGAQWHAMGSGATWQSSVGTVYALATLENGDVVAGGWWFDTVGGVPVRGVARWNGVGWYAMGSGLSQFTSQFQNQANIWDLHTLSDGSVVAGGGIGFSGGTPLNGYALWNGTAWTGPEVPDAFFDNDVSALTQLLDGRVVVGGQGVSQTAPTVYASSNFGWQGIGNLRGGTTYSLFTMPNGDLIVSPESAYLDGEPAGPLLRWDGTRWHRLTLPFVEGGYRVHSMVMFQECLIVGGSFIIEPNGPVRTLARWCPGPCTPEPEPCPADVDGSGAVDLVDLLTFNAAWSAGLGQTVPAGVPGDFDGDSAIDLLDLLAFLAEWTSSLGVECP